MNAPHDFVPSHIPPDLTVGDLARDLVRNGIGEEAALEFGGCQRSCRVRVLNQAASLKASASLFGVSGFRLT